MFNHKFFPWRPAYASMLEQYNQDPSPLLRFTAFQLFAHEVLGWFADNADLLAVKLTCVTLPHVDKHPLSIRLRHHFKLETHRGDNSQPALVANLDEYVAENLPYRQISYGFFELERSDTLVDQFMRLDAADQTSYGAVVYSFALRLDLAFEDVVIEHDLGMPGPLAS